MPPLPIVVKNSTCNNTPRIPSETETRNSRYKTESKLGNFRTGHTSTSLEDRPLKFQQQRINKIFNRNKASKLARSSINSDLVKQDFVVTNSNKPYNKFKPLNVQDLIMPLHEKLAR